MIPANGAPDDLGARDVLRSLSFVQCRARAHGPITRDRVLDRHNKLNLLDLGVEDRRYTSVSGGWSTTSQPSAR